MDVERLPSGKFEKGSDDIKRSSKSVYSFVAISYNYDQEVYDD